jgi:hypothetical protein
LEQHQVAQTLATATHDRLMSEFKAMRRGGRDFIEPLPVPIED